MIKQKLTITKMISITRISLVNRIIVISGVRVGKMSPRNRPEISWKFVWLDL